MYTICTISVQYPYTMPAGFILACNRLRGGFGMPWLRLLHSAFIIPPSLCGGFGWLCPAFRGSKFEVGSSMFGVHHKRSAYNSPCPPPSGWSGGILVPPWTYPIPVKHPQSPIFNQAGLSKTRKSIAEPGAKRRQRRKRDGNSAFSCVFCDF